MLPHPNDAVDWLRSTVANTLNAASWCQDAELRDWLVAARLDGFTRSRAEVGEDHAQLDLLGRIAAHSAKAVANLQRLLAAQDTAA